MMEPAEIHAALRRHPTFANLGDDALKALIARCTPRVFNVGQALWSTGDAADSAYILLKGRVERVRTSRPDPPRAEQYAEPGALLSLSALVHASPHTSSVTLLDRSELLELSRAAFNELFETREPVAFALIDALSSHVVQELRDANQRLHRVFGQPAETLRMLRRRMREEV